MPFAQSEGLMPSANEIAAVLADRGRQLFAAGGPPHPFTGDAAADELVSDLTSRPHAFVIACIADRQVRAEVAWRLPLRLAARLGGFEFDRLAAPSSEELVAALSRPEPLHRFPSLMAEIIHAAIQRIAREYGGDASRIWSQRPASATVVSRFLQFKGVGPKIATMATNILARDLKVPFADYRAVDVSVDVHVRRVFARLGLTHEGASEYEIIARARELCPEFPGLLDLPCWEVGRAWCRPTNPDCTACWLRPHCPSARC